MKTYLRHIQAWALLLVFVSMTLGLALHHHDEAERDVACAECLEHQHHAGHVSPDHDGVCCLLCQLGSVHYVASSALKVEEAWCVGIAKRLCVASDVFSVSLERQDARAPPAISYLL